MLTIGLSFMLHIGEYQIYFVIFGIFILGKSRSTYTLLIWEARRFKTGKLKLGERNVVGARVAEARPAKGMKQKELSAKLQMNGIEISTLALSLLEGHKSARSQILG